MLGSDYWFQKYGGPEFWQRLSERFYVRVTANPSLRKYFFSVREDRIKEVAGDMWQVVLGFAGPLSLTAIASQHSRLQISTSDFELYSSLLQTTLTEERLEETDISEIISNLDSLKQHVCAG